MLIYNAFINRPSPITGSVLALVLVLALADYGFKERFRPTSLPLDAALEITDASGKPVESSIPLSATSSSSSKTVVKLGKSTKLRTGVVLEELFQTFGLTSVQTSEKSLLSELPEAGTPSSTVLLKNNDRAMFFAMTELSSAKEVFTSLKAMLQHRFSENIRNLRDETLSPDDGAPMNILSFDDPGLSSEHLVFVRVRSRIYELHVSATEQNFLDAFIAALAR